MKDHRLCYPTSDLVRKYNSKFDDDPDVAIADSTVRNLFDEFPRNDNLEHVLRKVIILNQLYNARLWTTATLVVARRIVELKIDVRLNNHDLDLVSDIALNIIKGKTWHFNSFASKYCSFHQPDFYPMIDQYVCRLLNSYRRDLSFVAFRSVEFKDYRRFYEIVCQFKTHFKLDEFSLKEIDKFLWAYGTELFANFARQSPPSSSPPTPPNPH